MRYATDDASPDQLVPAHDGLKELERIAPGSSPAIFREAERLGAISAWWGHVPFAQWLMHVARPRKVVELGTHNGVSYAAFCSSVLAEGLDCRCVAVDTWLGDHQAGHYGDEVYQELKAWHDARYGAFSELLRCTFDEAAPSVADGSVDLLHIDGLHTYEAVQHDLQVWLPKLSSRGIVLLHDTNERSADFGVWRLWAELRDRYPTFGFLHSHGLGLIAVGAETPMAVRTLCAIREPARINSLEAIFSILGRRWSAEGELTYERTVLAPGAAAKVQEAVEALTTAREEAKRQAEELAAAQDEVRRRTEAQEEAVRERRAAALRVEEIGQELDAARHSAAEAREAADLAAREILRVRAEAAIAAEAVEAIRSSSTWRATQPLRNLVTRAPALRDAARTAIRTARLSWRTLNRSHHKIRLKVARSGLFDRDYYLAAHPDVAAAGIDPVDHYLEYGWREGRDPSPLFSTRGYLKRHEDVLARGTNPLVHYVMFGRHEGRAIVTGASVEMRWPLPRSRNRKALDLCLAVLREPSLGLTIFRESRSLGLRRSAYLAWETHAAPVANDYPSAISAPSLPGTVTPSCRESWMAEVLRVVPYYLDPNRRQNPPIPSLRIAVHLHLYYEDMVEQSIGYLKNIPVEFDLYVSVPVGREVAGTRQRLADALPFASMIHLEQVPNRGRDIAPLIVQFGQRLLEYDIVAHFHTKKSPHNSGLAAWYENIMDALCGSESIVAQILDLFARDAKTVYPAGNQLRVWDVTGWSANVPVLERFLEKHGLGKAQDYPYTEFPQGMMFWATSRSLRPFLQLPLSYEDFPDEPIPPDGTLAHTLERLLLLLAQAEPGRNYRIETPALSREPVDWVEARHDFSASLVHDTVKVLAYYLPQFHATPENSAWHGEGFTEWHKVRGAYPLFQGHYQQHVPHPDVGYYHLDAPDQLRKQAEMMRQAGVHGMIFYHYWFTGRLILEKPAQMLLASPDVQMPFCFCWANENWTRRWDGNEREILLKQTYSQEDAIEFIRYLIPFFRDERYIKVEGRPVLFVYRPSSIEAKYDYIGLWRSECEAAGLPAPYVVAVLTRGATSPQAHGMDAGAERVLHDWLGPHARDIRGALRPYWPLNGGVLDYREVAEHYMQKTPVRDFTMFRSLVPVWDNAARYASDAILLHNFTPEAMQRWVEHLIHDAEQNLPPDRRFVIVNAWNEWAEGAHLEPDLRFGYAYLNAIGRAISGHRFDLLDYVQVRGDTVLRLQIDTAAAERLKAAPEARRRFIHCLASSAILGRCRLLLRDSLLATELRALGLNCELDGLTEPHFTLTFSDLYLFPALTLERMLQMALRHPGNAICASPRNDATFLHDSNWQNGHIPYSARTGMVLQPPGPIGYKICAQAPCFKLGTNIVAVADRVSTVIRYHAHAERALLMNALLSLLSQEGCNVRACIGVQDMQDSELADLRRAVEALPWAADCQPVFRAFHSNADAPDLRSEMLNEMLRVAGPDYVAFLDYDDIMFPHAYGTLLRRLRETQKNATFARVYSTKLDHERGLVLQRDAVFTHGRNYQDFLITNHAPIHSFMLDMRKIDASTIEYFSDMKFMEDYYLTLQIFSAEGSDWDSLRQNVFIGDYIYLHGGKSNTLAIDDAERRRESITGVDYRLSETRIAKLKRQIT
ncbi:glycoside hydrolase family 99-like domain-containing protein [Falsiroseomonas sp.]|uniref:glycoside hydrolase family 99-like domain-containing protein n=1 Tax=Falsiroseomonas sp. TaxID=2870721 RepID=UPI0027350A12|nr:glycoside hydrolase family 99-like domain-containing protein [Falsiroseomonas sp.]MDP3414621.1 glycoside hydrolase family 99-like domain-containing protein [Falsiroseomonas sp.]